ncbi:MAG: aminoacetone oxidase family FAD-binding enzyme [Chloroflexi bacterium]|nr:aminoacetone oxidase family FAD-binding enzyme [Chloroflexota bacterium]
MAGNHQIIVIGAGAAGMIAAGRAAELGDSVLLVEKMERPGKKILMTGNGRCNLSNSRDMDGFIAQFGANGRFLQSAFRRFFRDDLLALLARYGLECRTKANGKVYPTTDNARDVVRAFQHYMADGKVTVRFEVSATGVLVENGRVSGIKTSVGDLPASAVIIAAGGSSHPQTGSTGDGFHIAAALGHTIVRLRPGLVPLVATDVAQAKLMQGAGLRNVRVTAFRCPAGEIDLSLVPGVDVGRGFDGQRPKLPIIESRTGNAVITHFGLSGPVILEMSLATIDALENGPVSVSIDLAPDMDSDALRTELQQAFDRRGEEPYRDIMKDFLPLKLVQPFAAMTGAPPDKLGKQITSGERESLLDLMKSLRFDIQGAYSMSTSLVTAGGISLQEIDPGTMASLLAEGVYFCGEVMDVDAGTGGYNLQAAFSTGYVAGESAASFV